jgi:hypothetical protein
MTMKRIALLVILCLPLLTSCAGAATWWSPGQFRMTAPTNDNAAASCAVTPILWAVSPSASRVNHLKITQGAYVWEDSVATTAGTETAWSPPFVPLGTLITATGWASDLGGPGCPMVITRMPLAITKPPAAPTLVAY